MRILYTLGIHLYAFAIRIGALFSTKARLMVEGWKDCWSKAAQFQASSKNAKTAWFHASSMGEFEQTRPLLEAFKDRHPEYKIFVTFFSPSGYEPRKNYPYADAVAYLPVDSPRNASKLIQFIRPQVAFFAKYDFWFNFLNSLRKNNVNTYLFSATFRHSQYFFKWYGKWFRNHLTSCFSHIFVQDLSSLKILQDNNINNCSIAYDTRFDRVYAIAQESKRFEEIEAFLSPNTKTIVAGSSWEPDEEYLKQYLDSHKSTPIQCIIAPHVISNDHIEYIENLFGKDICIRHSEAKSLYQSGNTDYESKQIFIVDNIGMLSSLYRYADIAYIGGGWGKGIHNILEAVTFGKPVVFGPNHTKFNEAHAIIQQQGGYSYNNFQQLDKILGQWLNDEACYKKASDQCTQYINSNLGGTNTILNHVI